MIGPWEVERLWERDSAKLRQLAALIAGILAHRHGPTETANVYRRIVGDPISTQHLDA